jgi:hypothetical protein
MICLHSVYAVVGNAVAAAILTFERMNQYVDSYHLDTIRHYVDSVVTCTMSVNRFALILQQDYSLHHPWYLMEHDAFEYVARYADESWSLPVQW